MLFNPEENWKMVNDDAIIHMSKTPENCVDFAPFSPPFPKVFAYQSSLSDIGNTENLNTDGKIHLSFFFRQLLRVMKPGRVVIVHCQQIPQMKRCGGQGIHDFRGLLIRIAKRAGFVYEYDWMIRKNPQAQAIRSKSIELNFAGLETDRAKLRGTLCDYLIKLTKPGENAVPIDSEDEVVRNDWIDWAEGTWSDIREYDTLNTKIAKSENDLQHICPLQLEVIRRLILLYTNPGEVVFSPFAGIGSEGFMALGGISPKTEKQIKNPRRFYGCELKPEYYRAAIENLTRAEKQGLQQESQEDLFSGVADEEPVEVQI